MQLIDRVLGLIFQRTKEETWEQVGSGATTAALGSSCGTRCPEEKQEIRSHLKDIGVCK